MGIRKIISAVLIFVLSISSVCFAQAQNTQSQYSIDVNLTNNQVMVYKKDQNGEYTIPYKTFVCSVGKGTPEGEFYTTDKYEWRALFGNVYGQYATRITGHILFHSVPYLKTDKSTLEYEEYNKLGQTASMGCIRLCVADVKWIYDNCPSGTRVRMFKSNEPMPLPKPQAIKIDVNDTQKRGWDPTDPDKNNPWHVVLANSSQNESRTKITSPESVTVIKNTNETEKVPSYDVKTVDVYAKWFYRAKALYIDGEYYISMQEILDFLNSIGVETDTQNITGDGFTVMLDNTCTVSDDELNAIIAENAGQNTAQNKKSVLLCFGSNKIKTDVYSYEGKNMFNIGTVCYITGCKMTVNNDEITIVK